MIFLIAYFWGNRQSATVELVLNPENSFKCFSLLSWPLLLIEVVEDTFIDPIPSVMQSVVKMRTFPFKLQGMQCENMIKIIFLKWH